MPYPWTGREADDYIERHERSIYRVVLDAIAEFLGIVRREIIPTGVDQPPDISAWPANADQIWSDILTRRLVPVLAEVMQGPLDVSIDQLDFAQSHLENVPDRLRDWPEQAFDEVRLRLHQGIAEGDSARQLRERVGDSLGITALTRTTEQEIEAIRDRIEAGVSPATEAALRDRLRDLQGTTDRSRRQWEWRADRIARTETAGAVNAGVSAYGDYQSAQTGVAWWRQWWSSRDARVRPTHRRAHGQVAAAGEPFTVGAAELRFPGDPTGPPQEVISCRCSVLLLDSGEAERESIRYSEYVSGLDQEGDNVS